MVDAVHVRGDNQPAEYSIDLFGYLDIAVVKRRRAIQNNFKDYNCLRIATDKDNAHRLIEHGDNDFQGVETQRRGRIKLDVGMMGFMQPP